MGGCKCTFRTCDSSTQKYPKMSFFHFPISKPDRIGKWIEYSNFHKLQSLSPSQAKNKSVCGLHFKDECFMNYKKNRLTPTAVPTLDRLGHGAVFDYSLGPEPEMTILPPTTEKHLIPPPGTLIWGQTEEFWQSVTTTNMANETTAQPRLLAKRPAIKGSLKPVADKIPKILNNHFSIAIEKGDIEIDEGTTFSIEDEDVEDVEVAEREDIQEITLVAAQNDNETHDSSLQVLRNTRGDIIAIDDLEFVNEEEAVIAPRPTCVRPSTAALEGLASAYETEIELLKLKLDAQIIDANQKIANMEAELAIAQDKLKLAEAKASTSEHKIESLEQALADAEARNSELIKSKNEAIAAVKVERIKEETKPIVTPPATLTKAQLFNGIKKYLSASMTSLVRMEMFGSAERAWKPDEKKVSVELLKLGESVYKYFRDEWRFRIPPLNMVLNWSNETMEEDEDDL